MEQQATKDLKQRHAYIAWRDAGYKGLIAGCTGFGKSRLGTWAAFAVAGIPTPEIVEKWGDRANKVLWVAPTEELRDKDIPEEFVKWEMASVLPNVDRICYASLHLYDCRNYRVIILDEFHHMTRRMYEQCKIEIALLQDSRILMLSATPPKGKREAGKIRMMEALGGLIWSISLDEGATLGLVSDYRIKKIMVPLDDECKYIPAGTKAKSFMTTEKKYHDYLHKVLTKMRIEVDSGIDPKTGMLYATDFEAEEAKGKKAKALFFFEMKYNQFIYNLKSKETVARKMMESMVSRGRTLIFAGSVAQCDALCAPYVYHSKLKTSKKDGLKKDMWLDKFRKKEIDYLGAVDALNEGVNIPNVKFELILQCDSNPRKLAQRVGRGVRYEEGHIVFVAILVAAGTADETWVESSLKYFDKNKVETFTRSLKLDPSIVSSQTPNT